MAQRVGTQVRTRGIVAYVEEHEHAYLVRGYDAWRVLTIYQARLALFKYLGDKKWSKIARMPARPLHTSEFGEKNPTGAVAFYFNIGPACDCHEQTNEYKP